MNVKKRATDLLRRQLQIRSIMDRINAIMDRDDVEAFYVGVTGDLPTRLRAHGKKYKGHDTFGEITNHPETKDFERALIAEAKKDPRCDNTGDGGEGIEPGEGPWVIYAVFR